MSSRRCNMSFRNRGLTFVILIGVVSLCSSLTKADSLTETLLRNQLSQRRHYPVIRKVVDAIKPVLKDGVSLGRMIQEEIHEQRSKGRSGYEFDNTELGRRDYNHNNLRAITDERYTIRNDNKISSSIPLKRRMDNFVDYEDVEMIVPSGPVTKFNAHKGLHRRSDVNEDDTGSSSGSEPDKDYDTVRKVYHGKDQKRDEYPNSGDCRNCRCDCCDCCEGRNGCRPQQGSRPKHDDRNSNSYDRNRNEGRHHDRHHHKDHSYERNHHKESHESIQIHQQHSHYTHSQEHSYTSSNEDIQDRDCSGCGRGCHGNHMSKQVLGKHANKTQINLDTDHGIIGNSTNGSPDDTNRISNENSDVTSDDVEAKKSINENDPIERPQNRRSVSANENKVVWVQPFADLPKEKITRATAYVHPNLRRHHNTN